MLITAGLAMSLKRKLVKTVCFASAAPWAFIRFLFHGDPAVLVTNVYLQDQEGLFRVHSHREEKDYYIDHSEHSRHREKHSEQQGGGGEISRDVSASTPSSVEKRLLLLTTVNTEDREKSRVSTKVADESYPETFRHVRHHQSGKRLIY